MVHLRRLRRLRRLADRVYFDPAFAPMKADCFDALESTKYGPLPITSLAPCQLASLNTKDSVVAPAATDQIRQG